jgi:putative ABC transport system ATP-binding protein
LIDRHGELTSEVLLDVRHLGRRHPTDVNWLIRDVTFTVTSGDRIAIVGPSGAGKTVLLRLLALLDSPDEGEIRFRRRPILDPDYPCYRSQVVYLHQRPHLLEGTVELNLRWPFRLKVHHQQHYDPARVVEDLARLHRPASFLERSTADLSGGEAQIVALLRAMQLGPLVLLLDEPTASADPATTRAIEQLVLDWCEADSRRALLCVTHQPDQVRRWTRRTLPLSQGRIEAV